MAVTGTPTSGDDTLTGDNADDEIIGQEGNDSIAGGSGADIIYGDVLLMTNGALNSNQAANAWSLGAVNGWFNTGSSGLIERWGDGFLGLSTADGSSFIELDASSGGGLDHLQTNLDLDTGIEYVLTFDAAARTGSGVNDDFQVTHNGVVVATISPTTTTTFTTYSITLTGISGTDTIGFREISGQNDGVGVLLDNVQVGLTQAEVNAGSFDYDDILDGGAGNDRIYGQEGNDTITGGAGSDYMEGGIGDDEFALSSGSGIDVIGDFTIGEDLLNVSTLLDSSGNPVDVNDVTVTSDGEGGSFLTFPNGEQVRLRGIAPSQLDTDAELRNVGIPCFARGALISTEQGERRVEQLAGGDCVATQEHGLQRIAWIGCRSVSLQELHANPKLRPIRIMALSLIHI